jgi:hypothetical protein
VPDSTVPYAGFIQTVCLDDAGRLDVLIICVYCKMYLTCVHDMRAIIRKVSVQSDMDGKLRTKGT